MLDFPIGGFSPPEGRLARGFKPPAFSRFLFQSAVKSAESFSTRQLLAGGRLVSKILESGQRGSQNNPRFSYGSLRRLFEVENRPKNSSKKSKSGS